MNEILVWFAGGLVSIFAPAFTYSKLTDSKVFARVKNVIFFLICVICLTLIYFYDVTFLGVISYFLFEPFLYYFIDYKNFKRFIFYIFIIWIYGMILDLIIMVFTSVILHFYKFESYWYVFECIISILVASMLIVLSYNKRLKKFTSNLYDKLIRTRYFDISLILFSICVLIASIVILFNLHHLSTSVLLVLLLLFTIVVFGILILYHVNAKENEIFLKTLKENNEFYIKMEDENRIFRHNLNAKLLGIKSVSNSKASILIEELLKESNQHINFVNNVKGIPYGFNGIIYEKIYPYLKVLEVKVDNQVDFDIFMVLTPRRYNVLVEKLVIALDNAIEACQKSEEKVLIISLYSQGNDIIVEIENTFCGEINLESLGNIGYSTKGKKRGLGLFSILRNNEANISVKIVNNFFISTIVAKQNVSK